MGVTISKTVVKDDLPALKKILSEMETSYVKAGFPWGEMGSPSKKGSHTPYSGMSEVSMVAIWNEFGVPEKNIASRPFFRNFLDGNREKIQVFIGRLAGLVISGKQTVDQALENIGLYCQAGIRSSIRNGSYEPNKPSTILKKKSSKPLIDTAQTINSVTYVKVKKQVTKYGKV